MDTMRVLTVLDECQDCVSTRKLSSNCSTATLPSSCGDESNGTSFDTDASWASDTDASSEDEPSEDKAAMASVQWHLEVMNTAAEETNIAQNTLNTNKREQHAETKRWAEASAHLARSVGVERLAEAAPWLMASRVCRSARMDVEEASKQLIGLGSDSQESSLSDLMAKHASAVENYQDAQRVLCQLQQKTKFSTSRLAALRPYLQAEENHHSRMTQINTDIEQSTQLLTSAKERYRKALRDLEELSEETHRRRGDVSTSADA